MDIAFEYINNKKSISEISRTYKVSRDTVRKHLLELGVSTGIFRNQYGICNAVDGTLFKQVEDPLCAYWLGFLYADGNVKKDRNEVSLTLQEKDKNAIYDFHSYCGNRNKVSISHKTKGDRQYTSYTSSFSSKEVKQNLMKLGCVPQKSLILKFPDCFQVPDDFIYDFIRGYIDGDGYLQYDSNKSRYRITILGTKDFLNGLLDRTKWYDGSHIYKRETENIYRLELTKKSLVKNRLELLYKDSVYSLDRKYKVYINSTMGV